MIKKNYRIFVYLINALKKVIKSKKTSFWLIIILLLSIFFLLRFFFLNFFLMLSLILLFKRIFFKETRNFPTFKAYVFDFCKNSYSRINIFLAIKVLLNLRFLFTFTVYFDLLTLMEGLDINYPKFLVFNNIKNQVLLQQREFSFFLAFMQRFFVTKGLTLWRIFTYKELLVRTLADILIAGLFSSKNTIILINTLLIL